MPTREFSYTQLTFNDGFKINDDIDELLSITRNNDLLVLAVKRYITDASAHRIGGFHIHVHIYKIDKSMPSYCQLQWSGNMSKYIKLPNIKSYLNYPERRPEYKQIQVYALKTEYADEYMIVYVWRKQHVNIFTHDSYLISDFHLVSVLEPSIHVIKKVMPQTTRRNDISIFSFVPFDNVFYSVICTSKKGTHSELYLMKAELKVPCSENPNWRKLAKVNYTPVINFNDETRNYKLNCNFHNTKHVIEEGYNYIYIQHYERSELSHEYKTKYGPLDCLIPHAKTCAYKHEYNYAVRHAQTCGLVLSPYRDIMLKGQCGKLTEFQIINPFADDGNVGFPELFNPNHLELLTCNLLLVSATKETKLGKSHKGWYSNKLLFYLDYDALTAELITTYRAHNNQVSVHHAGNTDSCYILLNGKQIMLMQKSHVPVCDVKTMDILYELLPAELVCIISGYMHKRMPGILNP